MSPQVHGGDADELRLLSNPDTFINLRGHGGSLSFLDTKVCFPLLFRVTPGYLDVILSTFTTHFCRAALPYGINLPASKSIRSTPVTTGLDA